MAKVIGRKQARVIHSLMLEACQDALRSSGLDVTTVGSIRFDSGQVTVKLSASVPEQKSKVNKTDSHALGFSDNIIGEQFWSRNTVFTIEEIHLRRPKYPIVARNARGTRYKFSVRSVATMLMNKNITHDIRACYTHGG